MKKAACLKHTIYVIIFINGIIFNCSLHQIRKNPASTLIRHKSIFLHPIHGLDILKSSNYWVDNNTYENLLIAYIEQVWKNLYAEFRRCEKYGLYHFVENDALSSVTISLNIYATELRNDTLFMTMHLNSYFKSEKARYSWPINAFGLCPAKSDTTITADLQVLVAAFSDYRRRFPYEEVVSRFYLPYQEK